MLAPDEPAASTIVEAFEGLANGRFQTATEVARWLETHPTFPRPKDGRVRLPFVINMIRRSVYAGFLCVKSQGISIRPGKHQPLISVDTWERAKARLDGRSFVAPRQQEIAEDFSLRNYVNCASCGGVLTAGWSKGQTKRYAYYVCQHKGCDMRYKSIRRASLEGDFLALIKTLTPAPQLLDMARTILRDLWEARLSDGRARKAQLNAELATISDQITGLTDRLIATNVPAVISAYERQIETLEVKRTTLSAQVKGSLEPRFSFEDISERVWQFLSNAWILREKRNLRS